MQRRTFLQALPLTVAAPRMLAGAGAATGLEGEIGITTGSFMRNLNAGTFKLLDLPRRMRDELDLRVIDLMTATLESMEPACVKAA